MKFDRPTRHTGTGKIFDHDLWILKTFFEAIGSMQRAVADMQSATIQDKSVCESHTLYRVFDSRKGLVV